MTLRQLIERFDPDVPIESAWMPPAGWYTDEALYQLERDLLFRSWQPVARLSQLERPGDYVSGCFVGEPWVVVRGSAGELHALANTCRHKGREVVTGDGHAEALVCGYHAWRYDLDGRLRKAPRMAGVRDFDREALSLPHLALECWGPWAFVNGNPQAPALRARIAELDAALERSHWGALSLVERRSWEVECNWKVYVDNYLDGGYHVPHMHPTLAAQLDMASYRTELFDAFSIQTSGGAPAGDERIAYDPQDRIGDGAIYAWLFPNLMLNRYGPCLDSNHVVPLGPGRCRVDYEFYFLETEGEPARRFIEQSIAQSDLTQREDIAICESVQRGLGSSSYDRGRYAPEVEQGEHHFHRMLAAAYRSALETRSDSVV